MKRMVIAMAAMIYGAPAFGADRNQAQVEALISRPPSELIPLIAVKGDGLDPSVEVSTFGVTQIVSKGLLASTTTENSFLRGFIDRKTGAVTAQIYHRVAYNARGWRFYNRATYESPNGIEEVEATRVSTDVSCGRYGCYYTEEMIVPVKFDILQKAAQLFSPSNPGLGIHYRLFAQNGANVDEALPGNEIAAFVTVVEKSIADREHLRR